LKTPEGIVHGRWVGQLPAFLRDQKYIRLERGLVRPTTHTLTVLAEPLGLLPYDLLCFPDQDDRRKVIDATRTSDEQTIRQVLKRLQGHHRSR
jgi:hypothetical protein